MSNVTSAAEALIRRRAWGAISLGSLLIVSQGSRMGQDSSLFSWGLWGAVVLAFTLWGSGALRDQSLRSLVTDEHSKEARTRAVVCGFWVALAAAVVCFAFTFLKSFGPRDAIQVIVTTGVAAALINFGVSERKALAA